MDMLSVATSESPDGLYKVQYRWHQHGAKQLNAAGTVMVTLAPSHTKDRPILAELSAIYHLLHTVEVQGKYRHGNGVCIRVSAGAIRKALAKRTIKKTDKGDTDKEVVARFALFLATRFLEAEIEVVSPKKWPDIDAKAIIDYSIEIENQPNEKLASPIGEVVASRHSLNRLVERFIAEDLVKGGMPIEDVPDRKWTSAWRTLGENLKQSKVVDINPVELRRINKAYGHGSIALHHRDSQMIFIVVRRDYGQTIVTTLRDNEYCNIVEKLGTFAGGQVIPHRPR